MSGRRFAFALLLLWMAPVHAHGGEWVVYVLFPLWGLQLLMLLHILLGRRPRRLRRMWLGPYLLAVLLPFIPLLWAENGYPLLLAAPFVVWLLFLVVPLLPYKRESAPR
jgi:hypothetical protein